MFLSSSQSKLVLAMEVYVGILKQTPQMFLKISVLKNLAISQENTSVGASF